MYLLYTSKEFLILRINFVIVIVIPQTTYMRKKVSKFIDEDEHENTKLCPHQKMIKGMKSWEILCLIRKLHLIKRYAQILICDCVCNTVCITDIRLI